MRVSTVIATLVLPLLAVAQQQNSPPASPPVSGSSQPAPSGSGSNNQNTNTPSPSPIVSTILTTIVGIGASHIETTMVSTILTTITPSAAPSPTQQTNATTPSSASISKSTAPLQTAPDNIDTGGNAPGGAPHPGQQGPNGMYGPPDTYISPALSLPIKSLLATVAGVALGGMFVLA